MKKSICTMLCAVILSSTMTVHAYAPEEQHTISYAFTYTVKASFMFDGKQAKPNGCYTSFYVSYVSDGWKKLEDNFGRNTGTAVFSNGSKQRKIHLSIACGKDGKIS